MVLLVDHQADLVAEQHCGAGAHAVRAVEPRQLLAHQVPLVQQLSVQLRQLVDAQQHALRERLEVLRRLAHLRQHAQPFAVAARGVNA
jgi:hypothetical protein